MSVFTRMINTCSCHFHLRPGDLCLIEVSVNLLPPCGGLRDLGAEMEFNNHDYVFKSV